MPPLRKDAPKAGGSFRRKVLILGVGCFLVIMLVTSFFGKKGVMDINRARRRYRELSVELKSLEASKSRLEQEIRLLEKDPKAVEKEAREKLWLIKPGEKVIVIPEKKK